MTYAVLSRPSYVMLLMLLLAFLLYGKSIGNGYSLDDHLVINPMTESGFKGIPKSFKSSYMLHEQRDEKSGYRPITLAIFALEIGIFGKHAAISHTINVVLYGLTGAWLYWLLLALFGAVQRRDQLMASYVVESPTLIPLKHKAGSHATQNTIVEPSKDEQPNKRLLLFALLATVLFMCHPIHSEVVNNIKSRDELLAFLFAIGAAWSLIKAPRLTWWRCSQAMLWCAVALLSKNTAMPSLVLLLLGIVWLRGMMPKQWIPVAGALLLGLVLYKVMGKALSDQTIGGRTWDYIENPLYTLSPLERIPTGLSVMLTYLKLLFVPHPLLYYYGYNQISICTWATPTVWLSIALHAALLVIGIRQRQQRPILATGILYYWGSALVYSNIAKVGPGIVAERFFYSGVLGFAILVAYLIVWCATRTSATLQGKTTALRPMAWIGTGLLLLFYTALIYARIPAWKSLETLLKTDMPYLNNSAKANLLYADVLIKDLNKSNITEWQLAEKHYRRAIEIYPDYYAPYNNLGFFYLKTNRFAEANEILLKAKEIAPQSSRVLYNLGNASLKLGIKDKAQTYFEEAVKYEPTTEAGMATFGALHNLYGEKGDTSAMTLNLIKAFINQPREPFFFNELMRYYAEQQKISYLKTRIIAAADTLDGKTQKIIRQKLP